MKYVTLVLAIFVVGLFIITVALDRRIDALEAAPMTLGQATGTPQIMTVLVGQGCVGAAGPNKIMIGLEEDEFTQCDAIDVHELVIVP